MAANYANRGRSYRDLSIDEFTARWITSFREIAADLRNYKARAVTADLKSEFDLRTIAPRAPSHWPVSSHARACSFSLVKVPDARLNKMTADARHDL